MQSNDPQSPDSVPPTDGRADAASSGTRYLDPAALPPPGDGRGPRGRGGTVRAVLAAMVLAVGISSGAVIVRGSGSAAADPSLAGVPSAPITPSPTSAPAEEPDAEAATTDADGSGATTTAAAPTTSRQGASTRETTTTRSSTAQRATTTAATSTTTRNQAVRYADCDAAREAGAAPLSRGEAGYRQALDPDGDGVACDAVG